MPLKVKLLPPSSEIETKAVLKQLSAANRYLALLNGRCATIPNENILINTLALQEAKESSAIENIITTHDELYKAQLLEASFSNAAAKEVSRYAEALKQGFATVRRDKLITNKTILDIQRHLEQNDAGYRRLPGTTLKNERTGEIVYTPPQDLNTIENLMQNLVEFMNREEMSDADPLVKWLSFIISLKPYIHFMMVTAEPEELSMSYISSKKTCWRFPFSISVAISYSTRQITTTYYNRFGMMATGSLGYSIS